jgi:hypothetical protein
MYSSHTILTGFRENLLTNSTVEVGRRTDSILYQKHNMFLFRKESKLKFQITPLRKLSAAYYESESNSRPQSFTGI